MILCDQVPSTVGMITVTWASYWVTSVSANR